MKNALVAVVALLGSTAALLAQGPVKPNTAPATGRTYFVSTSGDDAWPGTEEFPWKTLKRVSSMTFRPGDRVLLHRGDTWSGERLTLLGSGSYWGAWIGVGAYGSDVRPPHIMNPPYHPDTTLVDWTAIHQVYPELRRHRMKLAIEVKGDNWFISGIEISHTEEGILTRGDMGYWFEDLYIHNIGFDDGGTPLTEAEGGHLLMPEVPDYEKIGEATGVFPMWDPYPVPAMGSAIEAHGDKVTIRDVVVERATGGISGWVAEGVVENVFLDRVTMGGLTIGGSDLRVRHATVLNAGWPGQAYAWIGICITMDQGDSSKEVTDSEFAYTGAVNSDSGDEGALEFDANVSGVTWARNFIHENAGPAFEFGMGGPNQYIVVEDNVTWANGWRPWRWMPQFVRPEFCQDACPFGVRRVAIRGNQIHKAFPGQHLNHFFALEQPGAPSLGLANDWRFAEENAEYTVSDNKIYEAGGNDVPRPIPEPPSGRRNVARDARVSVSSGEETADRAIDGDFETEWRAAERKPWIELAWDTPQTIDEVWITDTHDLEDWGVSGALTFDGEQTIHVTGGIQNHGGVRKIVLEAPRAVRSLRYEVTRNVTECPGSQVGLGEIQAFEASPVVPAAVVPVVAGVIDFSDRPDAATLLRGVHYGVDWKETDWTTASDSETGNRYAYVDFPRNGNPDPTWAIRVLALPWGCTLGGFRLSGPPGAQVVVSQVGQETDSSFTCAGGFETCQTGWSAAGAKSNLVQFWIRLPSGPAPIDGGGSAPPTIGPSADLNDIHFDDLVIEGGGGR